MFDLSGKCAIVTGASYGLGEGFAHALADAGAEVVLAARSEDQLERVRADLVAGGATATAIRCDVSVEADVVNMVAQAIDTHGKVDVLINNAGISDLRGLPAEHYDGEWFRRVIDVDLVGAFYCAREVGRHMLERGGGSIVNIASMMGSAGNELNIPSYAAAKGGLVNLTKALAVEWADRNVRVNAVSPGFVVTEMTRVPLTEMGVATYVESRTPMRRLGELSDMLGPVLFLASDASAYVTGLDLAVDGGTNAGAGSFQITPGHHFWDTENNPRVGTTYSGLVPQTNETWKRGIPGIHFEMGDLAGTSDA